MVVDDTNHQLQKRASFASITREKKEEEDDDDVVDEDDDENDVEAQQRQRL